MAPVQLRGVYVPLITPFAGDGSVAIDAIERLAHEYLDAGVAGIVALGTTGEASALDADEKRAVIDACAYDVIRPAINDPVKPVGGG